MHESIPCFLAIRAKRSESPTAPSVEGNFGIGKVGQRRSTWVVAFDASGMGRAAAIACAREGSDVAISYYPTEEPDAREVIQLIQAEGRKAIPVPGDLRTESYCEQLVSKAISELGGLDVVIHFGEAYPLRRAGQRAELATFTSIYVQLAANDGSYTTGNIYGAGGGAGQP